MKKHILTVITVSFILIACNNSDQQKNKDRNGSKGSETSSSSSSARHFKGALTGGMKGDSIFFDINTAGTKLENLTFKGYWYCDGKLEREWAAGPEGSFTIIDNKVNDHISEPPGGGSTAWRFDLNAAINGLEASGTFRMNINDLGCNTGTLTWTATAD